MRHLLKPFAILHVIYLRKKYKRLTIKWRKDQTNQHIIVLRLIQAKVYYYHNQFSPWGYYHPSCVVGSKQVKFMNWLFPQKDFRELDLLVKYNPNTVTYYLNKIYKLSKGQTPAYVNAIRKQLIKWDKNY